jgi:hypothetical protein
MVDDRALTLRKFEWRPHGLEWQKDVGEKDRRVDAVGGHGL